MIMSCPRCCKQYDMEIVKKTEHFDYDGFLIKFSSDFCKCPECGELIQTIDQFQSSLDSLRNEHKKIREKTK